MLIDEEKNLRTALADVYTELCFRQQTKSPDPMRAPYELVETLIQATLCDDLDTRGSIHGASYLDDLDLSRYLLDMYSGKITMDEFNNITQRAYRQHLTDYVMGELSDYIDDYIGL